MTITTEQIYDVQKSGKSILEIFMQALARGDDVVIELSVPGETPKQIERLKSLIDLEAWQQRYQAARTGIYRMYNLPNGEAVIDGGNPLIRPTKPTLSFGGFAISTSSERESDGFVGIAYCPICQAKRESHDHGQDEKNAIQLSIGKIKIHMRLAHNIRGKVDAPKC